MVQHHLVLGSAHSQCRLADGRRHRLNRSATGDNDGGQRHQCQYQTTDNGHRSGHMKEVNKDGQTKQTKNNRRHRGQIINIDLNKVGPLIFRRKLLQVNSRRDTYRKRQHQSQHQGQQ